MTRSCRYWLQQVPDGASASAKVRGWAGQQGVLSIGAQAREITLTREILIRLPSDLFVNAEDPLSGSILVARDTGAVVKVFTGLTPAATSVYPDGDRWYLGTLLGQPVRWMPAP